MVRVVFSRPKIGCLLIPHLTPSVTSNNSAGGLAWCSIRPSRSACILSILLAERMPTFFQFILRTNGFLWVRCRPKSTFHFSAF